MIYSNILLAYDGSKASTKAFEHAVSLAKLSPGTKLHIVHVYAFPRLYIGEALAPIPASVNKEVYDFAVETSEKAEQLLKESGVEGSVELIQGGAAETILDYAKTHHCDLIVIGSRGLGGIKEFVLGSVSHNVVQHSVVPVLVVK
ncbi:Stress response protein NhaX [compost metagenome]